MSGDFEYVSGGRTADGRIKLEIRRKPFRTISVACCICASPSTSDVPLDLPSPYAEPHICGHCTYYAPPRSRALKSLRSSGYWSRDKGPARLHAITHALRREALNAR